MAVNQRISDSSCPRSAYAIVTCGWHVLVGWLTCNCLLIIWSFSVAESDAQVVQRKACDNYFDCCFKLQINRISLSVDTAVQARSHDFS